MIGYFDGKYAFLSNFYESPFEMFGIYFPTNEHFYQAMKSDNVDIQRIIASCPGPGEAKRVGRIVTLRDGWNDGIKEAWMWIGLCEKFKDPALKRMLLETGDEELAEGNWWGDQYWGTCNGVGKNRLGNLLMHLRAMIRERESERM